MSESDTEKALRLETALIEIEAAANRATGPLGRDNIREMLHAIGARADAELQRSRSVVP